MKEIDRSSHDAEWNRQRLESAVINKALLHGWKGGVFYRPETTAKKLGLPARGTIRFN